MFLNSVHAWIFWKDLFFWSHEFTGKTKLTYIISSKRCSYWQHKFQVDSTSKYLVQIFKRIFQFWVRFNMFLFNVQSLLYSIRFIILWIYIIYFRNTFMDCNCFSSAVTSIHILNVDTHFLRLLAGVNVLGAKANNNLVKGCFDCNLCYRQSATQASPRRQDVASSAEDNKLAGLVLLQDHCSSLHQVNAFSPLLPSAPYMRRSVKILIFI